MASNSTRTTMYNTVQAMLVANEMSFTELVITHLERQDVALYNNKIEIKATSAKVEQLQNIINALKSEDYTDGRD